MKPELILENLLTPPILFFMLGAMATWIKSDLRIPDAVAKLLSLYLLFAIGFQGGHKLSESSLELGMVLTLGAAIVMSAAVPVWSFFILRLRLASHDAAAIAGTYGSISAITFITAASFLQSRGLSYDGYMIASMALMESPAIIAGVLLARLFATPHRDTPESTNERGKYLSPTSNKIRWGPMLHEALANGAVVLLLGSMFIGLVTGEKGWQSVEPLVGSPFKGVLCLFLLDMGLLAAGRLRELKQTGWFLIGFAILTAPIHAALGIGIAYVLGMSAGNALLFAVLCGSASYIAAPAALRLAIPNANPSLYVPLSLGVTFPFNITLGIPLYLAVIKLIWPAG